MADLTHFRDSIAGDTVTMASILRTHPEAPVEHCPGWSVADLMRHHGDVLWWAATIIGTGEVAPFEDAGPSDLDALAAWYDRGSAQLLGALDTTDPHRPCWTFGRPPGVTSFWWRRQALEAAVHRWDAEHAAGSASGFDPDTAAEGIDEVATFFFPRQVDLDRTPPLTAPVVVRATDGERSQEPTTWIMPGEAEEAAGELAGSLDDLLLLLWRRRTLEDGTVTFDGDADMRKQILDALFAP